jgi:antitoxin component YwqK of YwqJK toxin-antitoxin module
MRTLPVLICLISIAGCKHKPGVFAISIRDSGKLTIVRDVYDKNGEIAQEDRLSGNSTGVQIYKEYEYGKIRCVGQYLKGKKDSLWIYFDDTGDTLSKENWTLGKQFGEQFQFYPFSRFGRYVLRQYSFNSLEGCRLFNMTLDPDSKITTIKGSPLYMAYNRDTINRNNTFTTIWIFGTPPGYFSHLQISAYDLSANQLSSQYNVSDTSKDAEQYYYGKKLVKDVNYPKPGRYGWVGRFTIMDIQGKTIVRDTISQLVTVR